MVTQHKHLRAVAKILFSDLAGAKLQLRDDAAEERNISLEPGTLDGALVESFARNAAKVIGSTQKRLTGEGARWLAQQLVLQPPPAIKPEAAGQGDQSGGQSVAIGPNEQEDGKKAKAPAPSNIQGRSKLRFPLWF